MNDGTIPVTAKWALWTKDPGSMEDYAVLHNSEGMFDRRKFAEIISRYGAGAPKTYPQVTISWVRDGDNAHLGLAIQDMTKRVDYSRRPIAETRYFCVPYSQLAQQGVTYEALYDAFGGYRLPANGLLSATVRPLNHARLAEAVNVTVMHAAAMLLMGRHVCVVQGECLDMRSRLSFLDAVAALLPYGMRSRLTASTWTSSTAAHRIRLSFCGHARDDANTIVWGEPSFTYDDGVARRYFDLLDRHPDMAALIGELAAITDPLSINEPTDREYALRLLEDRCGVARTYRPALTQPGMAQPAVKRAPEGLLESIADGLAKGRPASELDGFVHDLAGIADTLIPEERTACAKIIQGRALLLEHPRLDSQREANLWDAALRTGYGPSLTRDAIDAILYAAGGMTPRLLNAIRRLPTSDSATDMILASYADERNAYEILSRTHSTDLIAIAGQRPFDQRIIRVAYNEIRRRSATDEAEGPMIARALREHGFLADAMCLLDPTGNGRVLEGDARLALFGDLLRAGYPPPLVKKQFQEIVEHPAALSCEPLLVAAILLYGHDARDLLLPTIMNAAMSRSGLSRQTQKQVQTLLFHSLPRGPDEHPIAPPRSFGWQDSQDQGRYGWAGRLIAWIKRDGLGRRDVRTRLSPLGLLAILVILASLTWIVVYFSSRPGGEPIPERGRSSPAQQTGQTPVRPGPVVRQPPVKSRPGDIPPRNRRDEPQQPPPG